MRSLILKWAYNLDNGSYRLGMQGQPCAENNYFYGNMDRSYFFLLCLLLTGDQGFNNLNLVGLLNYLVRQGLAKVKCYLN